MLGGKGMNGKEILTTGAGSDFIYLFIILEGITFSTHSLSFLSWNKEYSLIIQTSIQVMQHNNTENKAECEDHP